MERDIRELEGTTCTFDSYGNDTHWNQYDGRICTVLDRKPEKDYDFSEMGSMWGIRFEDGNELDAFAFELEPMKGCSAMKMSDVIVELQKRIDLYGDAELVFRDYEDDVGANVMSVYYDDDEEVGVVSNFHDMEMK